ncbi:DUF885 domain-containing protein [Bacillus marasmi]|uniref:DUF885 domain-containing protein n=1 Tax=Bacillus marasmi TaxID=1926279 RepID=UPI0011CA335A|nr:DUF885 domain-containing protein [Bacillus marasmi]
MSLTWIQRYVLLVLRIGKAIQNETNDILYDFYGNQSIKKQVDSEPVWSGKQLFEEVTLLINDVSQQGFDARREDYLTKHLVALETVCRRIAGERITLREEVQKYFHVPSEWISETVFEEAWELYEKSLPGKGSIEEQLANYQLKYLLPIEKKELLPELIQRAAAEAFRRTNEKLIMLPKTQIHVEKTDLPVKAMAEYSGHYQAKIYVNTNMPFNIAELLSIVCHEGYPGHIAEFLLKEEHLVNRQGYEEQQVSLLLTPSFVVSEGIALMAMKSIFAPGEAEQWMANHIYPELGIEPEEMDLLGIQKAIDLIRGTWCNAALLLYEGRPTSEAVNYLMKYAKYDESRANYAIQSLQRPYCESYIFTYFYGRKYMEAALTQKSNSKCLAYYLTEQNCFK